MHVDPSIRRGFLREQSNAESSSTYSLTGAGRAYLIARGLVRGVGFHSSALAGHLPGTTAATAPAPLAELARGSCYGAPLAVSV